LSYHEPSTYDLSKFVEWWLRENPPEDPKLPLDFEEEE
jgi:hypothetical protein